MTPAQILKQTFGYDQFRPGQKEAVDALCQHKDLLAIMPTGAGKSLCFQVPALALDGITLVISPLISLMQDQVRSLCANGVPAAYFNRSLTPAQYRKALENFKHQQYKIVYAAPERLEAPGFLSVCKTLPITMIAVDEAHCISQWGPEFRPSYTRIPQFVQELANRPILAAFTATATPKVQEDIIRQLHLHAPARIQTPFDRPNLDFSILTPRNKKATILQLVRDQKGASTIIYCASRKACQEVSSHLNDHDIPCQPYHAGLDDKVRTRTQQDFINDRIPVIAATNAFGLGIDKPDVRCVIHYQMPASLEAYYQEAGRAGRDGQNAQCVLLYDPKDIRLQQFLIENGQTEYEDEQAHQQRITQDKHRLNAMIRYARSTSCLTRQILTYFGQETTQNCGHCANCKNPATKTDVTDAAMRLFAAILRTRTRYGTKKLLEIVTGKRTAFIRDNSLENNPAWGCLKNFDDPAELITQMLEQGYLTTQGEYPILALTNQAVTAIRNHQTIYMHTRTKAITTAVHTDAPLMTALKQVRKDLAREYHLPPYMIFSDATLQEMTAKKPLTLQEMLEISGIGTVKLEKYGDAFLEAIATSIKNEN